MSAPNFALRRNAKGIYACCMCKDYEKYAEYVRQEGYDPIHLDLWLDMEFDWVATSICDRLREAFGGCFREDKRGIGKVVDSVEFDGRRWYFTIDVSVESGRYDGACFDYGLVDVCGGDWDEVPYLDTLSFLLEDNGMNPGMAKIQAKNLQKRLAAAIEETQEKIDDILSECTPHTLQLDMLFSNGEAWYSDKKKAS